MNIPTQLTVTRIILTPVYLVIFFLPVWFAETAALPLLNLLSAWLLLAVYAVCELTDFLDGYIARKYNMVTDLGKVLDPFSDVIIRITYFICFTFVGMMPVWALALILYREFGILLVRMLSMKQGIALAANIWGKGKAVLYAVSAIVGLAFVFADRVFWGGAFSVPGFSGEISETVSLIGAWSIPVLQGLFILSAVVSVISFLTYLIPFLKAQKS